MANNIDFIKASYCLNDLKNLDFWFKICYYTSNQSNPLVFILKDKFSWPITRLCPAMSIAIMDRVQFGTLHVIDYQINKGLFLH